MFKHLKFAVSYALRNMIRDRQRTAFALFSIAAGVATVVALRMLGLMLTDALTSSAQAILRADVTVESAVGGPRISFLDARGQSAPAFTNVNIPVIDKWAAKNGYDVTYGLTNQLMQAAVVHGDKAGSPAFAVGVFIDPARYPFYDRIRAEDPAGTTLQSLLTGPDQVVIGHRLATQLGTHVGDTLRVGSAKNLQIVKGIVPDTSESSLQNFLHLMFSFVYVDRAYTEQFGLPSGAADEAFIRIPPDQNPDQVLDKIRKEWPADLKIRGRWRYNTASRLLKNNTLTADLISRFVLLSSLVALVIGGVGIVNTMLVSVNRRAQEIAVLKTLGLGANSVGGLLLIESLVLGFIGSLFGLGLGLLLSLFAQSMGEQAFAVVLPWRFSLDPLIVGMTLGMIITVIFSLLPTFIAGRVRPNLVLRSGNIPLGRAGCLPSAISLIVLVAGLSALSEAIIGNLRSIIPSRAPGRFESQAAIQFIEAHLGLIGTLGTFVVIAILLGLIWIVIWFLGHLPSFRNPNLRIAIRALTLHRGRTALSMFALIISMTALSATLIMTRSITSLLATSVSEPLGGNVIVLPFLPLSDTFVHQRLDEAKGVSGYRDVRPFPSELLAIDGDYNFDQQLGAPDDIERAALIGQLNVVLGVQVHGNPPRGKLVSGRYLGPEDAGKNHIVIPARPELDALGVKVGSKFTYRFNNQTRDFEVVGMVAPDERIGLIPFSLGDSAVQAPIDVAPRTAPFDVIIANVQPELLNDVMGSVGVVPGTFVFDTTLFDSIINRILSQMAAIPLLVEGLSLFAATVLIATTVSLATLERRRQIAILKAMGVTRQQALNQILLENAIIGLAGGIISLLPTLAIIELVPVLTSSVGGFAVHLPLPVDLVIVMLVLSVLITLLATLLTAWGASGEKPLAALRYE